MGMSARTAGTPNTSSAAAAAAPPAMKRRRVRRGFKRGLSSQSGTNDCPVSSRAGSAAFGATGLCRAAGLSLRGWGRRVAGRSPSPPRTRGASAPAWTDGRPVSPCATGRMEPVGCAIRGPRSAVPCTRRLPATDGRVAGWASIWGNEDDGPSRPSLRRSGALPLFWVAMDASRVRFRWSDIVMRKSNPQADI